MKKFLKSYRYSSYLDYVGEERIEKSIIKSENFPDYFDNSQSFNDFVENYFTETWNQQEPARTVLAEGLAEGHDARGREYALKRKMEKRLDS